MIAPQRKMDLFNQFDPVLNAVLRTLPFGENTISYKIQKYLKGLLHKSILDPLALPQESIDLIVTSPPYNVGIDYSSNGDSLSYEEYLAFSEAWLKNCYLWSKSTGRLCLNVPLDKNKYGKNSVGSDITQIAKSLGWQYQATIIWNEQNISRRTAWGSWLSASAPYVIAPVELIIVFYKDAWKKAHQGLSSINKEEFMQWTNGVWSFNGESSKRIGHPAPFPRELPKRCIKLFSFVDDVILDPFSGSGTTLVEAISNNRYAYGLDVDEGYIALAHKRIQKECL
jgi:site-specific DNA-methyltransferase (adenine-specific)